MNEPGSPPDGVVEVVDPALMREVLGHFASGVTVVTALDDDEPIGFTCQSFSSLSLDPPLVVFAPARTSRTWPRLRELGRFCVNVLAEDQDGLSAAFARSGGDKFAGVHWRPSRLGRPVLDDVVAWIDCELWAEYDGGDHTLVAARVLDLGADGHRRPLLFHRGSYSLLEGPRG
ncbi:flavin reductase family protein [Geodermatophilus sabuli]|uniref:NADH-FMN oxidoreductase RutF, flavin reductase (DIM6/NTAB) family n=1 Tax=Geodermatophilus sabuli TaxID=1564158 RepID=A0A285EHS7_9ACTN|nr:flavin reductase family protein [Geodermatophilus sabuli]MBB3086187.1 flavin reductase (DIM6/NTAB) family NADH-FMN oxidoreductase RutF [Geodermatophilus sabuli]SNX97596.1 NADH-FMN oxidoreductase RutF, flavin reductase (DIM6/NTAB) family [Geodermatophilus sabuli]